MEKFLDNEYRKLIWDKSKQLIGKISTVIDIDKVVVLGSFTTKKERPADVDFIVMIKTKDSSEDWSTDIQFVPSTKFGEKTIADAEKWMEEKYGKDNYQIFEFDISDFNGVVGI
jgi:hypothetical protein